MRRLTPARRKQIRGLAFDLLASRVRHSADRAIRMDDPAVTRAVGGSIIHDHHVAAMVECARQNPFNPHGR